ncbi:MAG: hypothetical protein LBV54_02095 [Puniceicoccales bacterium]|nr:hypothetical protein [Puniceicoccales bacterium]
MNTFFKILFGVLLGVVGCLGWQYYEAQQAAEKGLQPGWIPLRPVEPRPAAPAKTVKPAPAVVKSDVPKPATPAPAPKPVAAPKPVKKPENPIPLLSSQPYRWPKNVTLLQPFDVPLKDNNGVINGAIPLSAGVVLEVRNVVSSGHVLARVKGLDFYVPANLTDLLQRALPEGTPPPPPPPRPAIVQDTPKAKPPSTPPRESTPPPASGGSKSTLFGTPIR